MEAVAVHSFSSTNEDELNFEKGSVLKIIKLDEENQWHKAELEGREGFVPANYLQMKPHDWFYGRMGRTQAEQTMLNAHGSDGIFIIRESESTPGDFTLSVKFQGQVQHFKVLRDGSGKYFLWVVKFNSLNQLVEYHRTSSVSRSQQIFLKDLKPCQTVRALYDFEAADESELAFKKGDVITLGEKPDENWWNGELNGKKGMFPASYVELIE